MHESEFGAFADGANPTVRRASVESLAITAKQDRAGAAFADGEVERSSGPGYERDGGGLGAFCR